MHKFFWTIKEKHRIFKQQIETHRSEIQSARTFTEMKATTLDQLPFPYPSLIFNEPEWQGVAATEEPNTYYLSYTENYNPMIGGTYFRLNIYILNPAKINIED